MSEHTCDRFEDCFFHRIDRETVEFAGGGIHLRKLDPFNYVISAPDTPEARKIAAAVERSIRDEMELHYVDGSDASV